jgi:hypothetical protein
MTRFAFALRVSALSRESVAFPIQDRANPVTPRVTAGGQGKRSEQYILDVGDIQGLHANKGSKYRELKTFVACIWKVHATVINFNLVRIRGTVVDMKQAS